MRKHIYIKIENNRILARLVGQDKDIEFPVEGVKHPRTIASDYDEIKKSLARVIKSYRDILSYIFKPVVLIHLIPMYEGGYTKIELYAFQKAAMKAGAICLMCDDKYAPLSNSELKEVFELW